MRERSSRRGRQYAAIPNEAMRDQRLSIEARGLLALLMTYSDDWEFHKSHLMGVSGLKDGKFTKVMKELREAGYVEMISHRNDKGHLEGRTWIIRDEAPTETAKTTVSEATETAFNGTSVKTETGENTPHKKTNSYKKTNSEEDSPLTPQGGGGGFGEDQPDFLPKPCAQPAKRQPKVEGGLREGFSSTDEEFELVWEHYPRKVSKGASRKAWAKARRTVSFYEITRPLGLFIRLQKNTPIEKIPHLSTWLNGERWTDDQTHAVNRAETSSDRMDRLHSDQSPGALSSPARDLPQIEWKPEQ